MRRFATFFKGFAKGFFKIAKVIRKIPNEFRTSKRNASRSLAVTAARKYSVLTLCYINTAFPDSFSRVNTCNRNED